MKHRSSKAASVHAIPTKYHGVQFRSRLEATWAAFFDNCGWRWEYEPMDFRGWIPDFILIGKMKVLVEVKPIISQDSQLERSIDEALPNHQLIGNEHVELLIVGSFPIFDEHNDQAYIGWLSECDDCQLISDDDRIPSEHECCGYGWWELAPLGFWAGSENKINNVNASPGFCHEAGSFTDRMTGCYDGGCYGQNRLYDSFRFFKFAWSDAKNQTQWKRNRK